MSCARNAPLTIGVDTGLSGAIAVLGPAGEIERLADLQATQIGIELVTPAVRKRALGLSTAKAASLHKARLLFPGADLGLARHDGRAEALLLAHWALTRASRGLRTRD